MVPFEGGFIIDQDKCEALVSGSVAFNSSDAQVVEESSFKDFEIELLLWEITGEEFES